MGSSIGRSGIVPGNTTTVASIGGAVTSGVTTAGMACTIASILMSRACAESSTIIVSIPAGMLTSGTVNAWIKLVQQGRLVRPRVARASGRRRGIWIIVGGSIVTVASVWAVMFIFAEHVG